VLFLAFSFRRNRALSQVARVAIFLPSAHMRLDLRNFPCKQMWVKGWSRNFLTLPDGSALASSRATVCGSIGNALEIAICLA
jgi:hypothetical protein